jgi:hypothetical protein
MLNVIRWPGRPSLPLGTAAREDSVPARREWKYLLPRERVDTLRRLVRAACEPDRHARSDGTYRIRSLYLDRPDCGLFHASRRDAERRHNLRLRCYPDAPASPVFAEVKSRIGDAVHKTRGRLPAAGWLETLASPGRYRSPALDNFLARSAVHDARPIVVVEYRREAFVSTIDAYARVSIDTSVVCELRDRMTLDPLSRRRPIDGLGIDSRESPCVVELKWAGPAPRWMAAIVEGLEVSREAFSKFRAGTFAIAQDHWALSRDAASPWSAP